MFVSSFKDQQKSCKSDKENIPSWRETINDLRNSDGLFQKPVAGKIVQKSCLRSYETKQKVKRFFFYVAVADETSCIKVMVYGEERFKQIKENNFYMFRNVKMEMFDRSNEKVLKVFKYSTVSRTTRVDVPEKLEVEAQTLIYRHSPVCSIAKAKLFDDKTLVSVEGTVTKVSLFFILLRNMVFWLSVSVEAVSDNQAQQREAAVLSPLTPS
ncbi:uncharacterized protein LOC111648993 [Seriola lalandi dorsalis]|uniref:uncharacterized protein LOC111648993 n=1 Tax=Seriola lalandi dorsalis TaxID=1841481 RepID=UPI000C6FB1DE|nr:uncharacterized protein LOC111648993 [Seriola lalandi dorsalis]